MQEVVLLVATTNELIAQPVIDVQEEVGVLAGILFHDGWQGPLHQRQGGREGGREGGGRMTIKSI